MSEHKRIEPEDLEVGMKVAYPYWVDVGYRRAYRYPRWIVNTVKRITPKRTKVVLVGKDETKTYEVNLKDHSVYVPDETMLYENECINVYKDSEHILSGYRNGKWRTLYSLPDDKLKEVHGYLTALDAILNKGY